MHSDVTSWPGMLIGDVNDSVSEEFASLVGNSWRTAIGSESRKPWADCSHIIDRQSPIRICGSYGPIAARCGGVFGTYLAFVPVSCRGPQALRLMPWIAFLGPPAQRIRLGRSAAPKVNENAPSSIVRQKIVLESYPQLSLAQLSIGN
jgi:hypothetical protein